MNQKRTPGPRQRKILTLLSDGEKWREDEIKSSFSFLQTMYFCGWLEGAGYSDDRGSGNYKNTRVWWITDAGREAIALVTKE